MTNQVYQNQGWSGLPCGEDGYSIEKISQSDDKGLYNMSSLQTKYNYSSTSYS